MARAIERHECASSMKVSGGFLVTSLACTVASGVACTPTHTCATGYERIAVPGEDELSARCVEHRLSGGGELIRVEAVRLIGLKHQDPSVIRSLLETKPNTSFSSESLDRDLRLLRGLVTVDAVHANVCRQGGASVRVDFHIREGFVVDSMEVNAKKSVELCGVKVGSWFEPRQLTGCAPECLIGYHLTSRTVSIRCEENEKESRK